MSSSEENIYKLWCIRLNIARISMRDDLIRKILDEIDAHFHNQQGGH